MISKVTEDAYLQWNDKELCQKSTFRGMWEDLVFQADNLVDVPPIVEGADLRGAGATTGRDIASPPPPKGR